MRFRYLVALAGLVAASLLAAVCLRAGSPQSGSQGKTPAMGVHLQAKGIANFGQVSANLYRGAQPNNEGFETLKKTGVDIVVDLRGSHGKSEEDTVKKLGMQYVSIPSHCPFPSDQPWAKFLKVIEDNPGKKVFVHCRLGDDRTGMAVASYRMAEQGWSAADALKEMQAFGFTAIHHAMCPGLEGYEEEFPERLKKSPSFRDLAAQKDSAAK